MAEDIVSIGIALDTSKVLQGTRQVDTALKQVAAASTITAQATQKVDAAAKSAGQAFATESQSATQVSQALRQTAQAATATATATQNMGSVARGATSSMQGLASQVLAFGGAQAGVLGVTAAVGTLTTALTNAAQTAMKAQSLTASFKAISGGATAANADLGFLRQTADRLGTDFVDLAQGFKSIAAASQGTALAGQATRDIFTAIAEKATTLQLSSAELNGALLAVGQMISKGTVSAEELRGQLGERLPGAFQIAARAMGVTTAELGKMLEQGQIATADFLPKFAAQIKSELGGATSEASQTAAAAMARFGNSMRDLQLSVGQELLPALTSTVRSLTDVVNWFNKATKASEEYAKARTALESAQGAAASGLPGAEAVEQRLALLNRQLRSAEGYQEPQRSERIADLSKQVDQANKDLAKLKQNMEDVVTSETFVLPVIPGAAAKGQVETALKGITTQIEAINRQQQAGLPAIDALGAKAKVYSEALEAARKALAAQPGTFGIIQKSVQPAIDAVQKKLEQANAEKDRLTKAPQEAAAASREAEQERKRLERERERDREQELRLDKQQADEVGRTHQRSMESLRQLNAKYTEARTETDADRASKLAASLAYSQHAEEARNLAAAVDEATKKIEDAKRVTAQLPALREQAQESAGALSDITRLRGQLEPRRRDLSRAEQHAQILADLEKASKGDPDTMRWAREQSLKTLALEESADLWKRWEEAGLSALDHVGDALEEFALKGKLDFKGLIDAMASDLFRFATQTLMNAATKKGGWLEGALDLGLKALGLFGGGGGGVNAGGFSATDISGAGYGGDFSLAQHGGPAYANSSYIVGEAGPELFVPKMNGTILPHGQGVSSPTVVNVHVSGVQDAQSFVQSRGAVSRAMLGALSQARQQM